MSFLPCLLCGSRLEQRTDKHNKPYFICDPCGIQLFVRRRHGIDRLQEIMHAFEKNLMPFQRSAERVFEVQALLAEIDGTKEQIMKLNEEIGFFFPDEEKLRSRDALTTRLETLLKKLEDMCAQQGANFSGS
jgi:chaperonin cofactor prefoldin